MARGKTSKSLPLNMGSTDRIERICYLIIANRNVFALKVTVLKAFVNIASEV